LRTGTGSRGRHNSAIPISFAISTIGFSCKRAKKSAKTLKAAEVALTKLQQQVDEEMHPKTDITVAAAIAQWFLALAARL
jgi:hypothetical protein